MFCCLPDQYGYWYKQLGQDAVGQCSKSSDLPEDSEPAVQVCFPTHLVLVMEIDECSSIMVMEVSRQKEYNSQSFQYHPRHQHPLVILCITDGLYKSMTKVDAQRVRTCVLMEARAVHLV